MTPKQGDIFWLETDTERRPVLVITRDRAIPVLNRVVVAPITRTIRGIPTEVALSKTHGLPEISAASFDNIRSVPKTQLFEKIGFLPNPFFQICRALEALADC